MKQMNKHYDRVDQGFSTGDISPQRGYFVLLGGYSNIFPKWGTIFPTK